MKPKKKYVKRAILTALLVAGIFAAVMLFINDNSERIALQNEEYIGELTKQRAISIDNLMSENLTFIRSTAYLYGQSLTSPWADVAVVRDYEENSAFELLRFIDTAGDNYTSRGVQSNLSDREYFQAGMRGESGITYVPVSRVTGQKQIGFYAPVYYQNDIIGVMVGFYGEEYIDRLLSYELFGYEGEGWLCSRDGTVLGSTLPYGEGGFFDFLKNEGGASDEEISKIRAAFAEGRDISFTYTDGGGETAVYAIPLNMKDWVLIRNFPSSASENILSNANREGMLLLIEIVILFAVYGLILALDVIIEQKRTREANKNANDVSKGVSSLFDCFIALDLTNGRYKYISGHPQNDELQTEGDYSDLCAALLSRIDDKEQMEEAKAFIAPDRLKQALESADSVSFRAHAPLKDDEWFTYNFIVIERNDSAPARLLLIRQDVTLLRRREEIQQQKLEDALHTAERASRAKTEFLFNMSHDLRTPMNAIIGYTELAKREGVSKEDMRGYIEKIDSSGEHLLALINDILEMSRIESGKITLEPEKTDLVRLVNDAKEMLSSQTKLKRLTLTADTDGVKDRLVMCDKNRLNRVLLNLLSNACKFTKEGGHIWVTLKQSGASDGKGDYVLSVKDDGIGMSREFVSKLFTPFERERSSTVSKTQGTGLGLSISKSFIEMMGGAIEVKTEQGAGTEFMVRVSFPIVESGDEASLENDKGENVDFTGMRLLLAEDNEINREIATMILTGSGFNVETAENGEQALNKLAASEPGYYDAVLMDIQMPIMDGYTAAREIRKLENPKLSGIPIIAMTANAFKEDIQNAKNAGMNAHIAKPLNVETMLKTLSETLRRK